MVARDLESLMAEKFGICDYFMFAYDLLHS
jgi:hypothetical protein